jgi:hypothetical protein
MVAGRTCEVDLADAVIGDDVLDDGRRILGRDVDNVEHTVRKTGFLEQRAEEGHRLGRVLIGLKHG